MTNELFWRAPGPRIGQICAQRTEGEPMSLDVQVVNPLIALICWNSDSAHAALTELRRGDLSDRNWRPGLGAPFCSVDRKLECDR